MLSALRANTVKYFRVVTNPKRIGMSIVNKMMLGDYFCGWFLVNHCSESDEYKDRF